MNRSLPLTLALATAFATPGLVAQTATHAATAPAAAASAPAPVAPQAVPAKIAIIAFQQAVINTNEGQRALADLNKKYEPQKGKIEGESNEVNSLRKQLEALPANTPDDERATRLKAIDTKEKQLQRDEEDASNAYQGELQEALGRLAQKVGQAAVKYAQENGFTLLMNVGGSQQGQESVLWALSSTDVTQAVVNAYNASSGIAAPPPSAPSPAARRTAPGGGAH
jgi:Skp family chaperone for outer membrane proteins